MNHQHRPAPAQSEPSESLSPLQELVGAVVGAPSSPPVPPGDGMPVPASVLELFEKSTGERPEARIHMGPEASALCAQQGARAITHGADIYLAEPGLVADERLLLHELTHVVQNGSASVGAVASAAASSPSAATEVEATSAARSIQGGDPVQVQTSASPALAHRDVSYARERLHRSTSNLVITDEDVQEVVSHWAGLDDSAVAGDLRALGADLQNLWDEAPDTLVNTPGFVNIIGLAPDPPIRKLNVRSALYQLSTRQPPYRRGVREVARLLANDVHDVRTLRQLLGIHFNIAPSEVGIQDAEEEATVRRLWATLEALPDGSVQGNGALRRIQLGYSEGGASGLYDPEQRELSVNAGDLSQTNTETAEPGDPLYGVNRFDKVVRHEVGHAVDEAERCSDAPEARQQGPLWREFHALSEWYEQELLPAFPTSAFHALSPAMRNQVFSRLDAAPTGGGLAAILAEVAGAERARALASDPLVRVIDAGTRADAWRSVSSNPEYAGRKGHFGHNSIVSFQASALGNKVSTYQFKSPGEWFAELYAAFHDPTGPNGALIRDSGLRAWVAGISGHRGNRADPHDR